MTTQTTQATQVATQVATQAIEMQIINAKNTALNDLTIKANSAVLLKMTTSANGNTFIKGVAISGLKKTDETTIVKHLLTAIVAEHKTSVDFDNDFATIKLNGKDTETGIHAKKFITRYLNTDLIFRSDSNGKIVKAIKLHGQKLNETALKVSNRHLLATCNRNDLRAVIHHQSKAVIAQFKYIDNIIEMINELSNEATTSDKVTNKAKSTTAKVTNKATAKA